MVLVGSLFTSASAQIGSTVVKPSGSTEDVSRQTFWAVMVEMALAVSALQTLRGVSPETALILRAGPIFRARCNAISTASVWASRICLRRDDQPETRLTQIVAL